MAALVSVPFVALALLVVLLVIAAPIYLFLFAPSALALLALTPNPPFALASMLVSSLNQDTLVAVPMYLLLGNILTQSGAAKVILDFFESLVRHWTGGLAIVSVLASAFFAGMTGSSVADAAAVGAIMIPALLAAHYERPFVCGLICAGGTLGTLVPPSFGMILYSLVTGESLGRLFIASLLPGLLIGGLLLAYVIVVSRRRHYGWSPAATWRERGIAFMKALPMLLVPTLILGSIYGGWSTPVEAASVGVVYTVIASRLVYRQLTVAGTLRALRETARMTATILLILGASQIMAFVISYLRVPQALVEQLAAAQVSPPLFLLLVNALIFVLGIPLDPPPLIFMTMPILHPMLASMHVDPIHFGVIMMVNMQLAVLTPPVGAVLFVVAAIAKAPVHEVFRGVMPFIAVIAVGLLVVTYWPALSLTLGGG